MDDHIRGFSIGVAQVKSYGSSIEFHLLILHPIPKTCKKMIEFLTR